MSIPARIRRFLKRPVFLFLSLFVLGDYVRFRRSFKNDNRKFLFSFFDVHPVLGDKTSETAFDPHYTYHVAWAIRCAKEINPTRHVDVGSSLYFCTTLSAFIPTDFYDYRPANIKLSGLSSLRGDLLRLPFSDGECRSLSCLHTLEHVGLGRYGDPIDARGDLKAIAELSRSVAPGGSLLVVVPTGTASKIEFNGHRIYSYRDFTSYFPDFTLHKFSYIPEKVGRGSMIEFAKEEDIGHDRYGCGCYWFVKSG